MKQPKQPRPGPGRLVHLIPPVHDSRPAKAAPVESPDAARSVPHMTHDGGAVKGHELVTAQHEKQHPFKPAFVAPHDSEAQRGEVYDRPDQQPRAGGARPQAGGARPDAGGARPDAGGRDAGAGGAGDGDQGRQYVRLRMRLRGEQLSVIDSHLVEGPLGQVTGFPGTNAYEVTLDGRLLHAGALPDLGVQRSFPNPAGPQYQHGHFITERDVVEFTARVPAEMLTPDTVSRVSVTLHRVSEEAKAQRLGVESLDRQFERQVRPVARLEGLPETVLPEAIAARGGRTPTV